MSRVHLSEAQRKELERYLAAACAEVASGIAQAVANVLAKGGPGSGPPLGNQNAAGPHDYPKKPGLGLADEGGPERLPADAPKKVKAAIEQMNGPHPMLRDLVDEPGLTTAASDRRKDELMDYMVGLAEYENWQAAHPRAGLGEGPDKPGIPRWAVNVLGPGGGRVTESVKQRFQRDVKSLQQILQDYPGFGRDKLKQLLGAYYWKGKPGEYPHDLKLPGTTTPLP